MALPDNAFRIRRKGRVARLKLRNLPLVESFQFGSGQAIAAKVSMDLLWYAAGDFIERGEGAAADPTSPAAFTGHFAEAGCAGWISGSETGFAFESGELTAEAFFAEMGEERNGVFLS